MNEIECINKIKSVHTRAMQEINSYIKDYAFSKFGIREGDILYYQHFNFDNPTYLYVKEIQSNVEYVLSRGAQLRVGFYGPDVDKNGFKLPSGCSLVYFDGISPSKLISITDIIYRG